MYLVFYISSHGFGHMTRCLSIIEYILNNSDYNLYIACSKNQNDFARIYLSKFEHRIIYKDILTDIGFINKNNSLEIDVELLESKLVEFILSWDDVIKNEYEYLKNLDIKCIINDISPIGCILGEKLKVDNFFVSNFSWVEQYEYLNLDKFIIDEFRKAYSYINKFIKYNLCLNVNSIKAKETYEFGFICRSIDKVKVNNIRNKYGESIFITCGKSANLKCIGISNFKGTIFITSGIDIRCGNACEIVELPIDTLDTQNYIAASNIVIAKAGWGTIAEGIIGHSKLVLIERNSAKEDSFNISSIKNNNLGISIKESDLYSIDISKLEKNLNENINLNKLKNYKNDVKKLVDIILK